MLGTGIDHSLEPSGSLSELPIRKHPTGASTQTFTQTPTAVLVVRTVMQRLQRLVTDNTIHVFVLLVYIYNARYVQLRGGRFLDRASLLVLRVQTVGVHEIVLCFRGRHIVIVYSFS